MSRFRGYWLLNRIVAKADGFIDKKVNVRLFMATSDSFWYSNDNCSWDNTFDMIDSSFPG